MAGTPARNEAGRLGLRIVPDTSEVEAALAEAIAQIEKARPKLKVELDLESVTDDLRKLQAKLAANPLTIPTRLGDPDNAPNVYVEDVTVGTDVDDNDLLRDVNAAVDYAEAMADDIDIDTNVNPIIGQDTFDGTMYVTPEMTDDAREDFEKEMRGPWDADVRPRIDKDRRGEADLADRDAAKKEGRSAADAFWDGFELEDQDRFRKNEGKKTKLTEAEAKERARILRGIREAVEKEDLVSLRKHLKEWRDTQIEYHKDLDDALGKYNSKEKHLRAPAGLTRKERDGWRKFFEELIEYQGTFYANQADLVDAMKPDAEEVEAHRTYNDLLRERSKILKEQAKTRDEILEKARRLAKVERGIENFGDPKKRSKYKNEDFIDPKLNDRWGRGLRSGFKTYWDELRDLSKATKRFQREFRARDIFDGIKKSARSTSTLFHRLSQDLSDESGLIKAALVGFSVAAAPLSAVVGDVAALGGAFNLLPAAIFGGVGAVSALAFGLKGLTGDMRDMNPNMRAFVAEWKKIVPAWDAMVDRMSMKMFEGLNKTLRETSAVVLPDLTIGMERLGEGWNKTFKSLGAGLQDLAKKDTFSKVLSNTATMMENFAPGLRSFINGFGTMSRVGSEFFPRFGDWLTDVMGDFERWAARNEANGNMKKWIETGVQGFKDLGSSIWSVIRAFNAFVVAGRAVMGWDPGEGLTKMAEGLDAMADKMHSPEFQQPLQQFMSGMIDGFMNFKSRVGPAMGPFFTQLSEFVAQVAPGLGDVFGQLSANMLNFGKGLMETLGPALQEFLPHLTKFLEFLGKDAEGLGQSLGTALGGLLKIIEGLLPMIQGFIEGFDPAGKARVIAEAVDKIGGAFQRMGPILGPVMEIIGKILSLLWDLTIGGILHGIMNLAEGFSFLVDGIKQMFSGDFAGGLKTALLGVLQMLGGAVQTFLSITFLGFVRGAVMKIGGLLLGSARNFVPKLLSTIYNLLRGRTNPFSALVDKAKAAWNGIKAAWNGAGAFFAGLGTKIKGALSGAFNTIKNLGVGAWNGIKAAWGKAGAFFSGLGTKIKAIWSGVWNTIKNLGVGAWNGIKAAWNKAGAFFSGLGTKIKAIWSGVWNAVREGARRAVDAVVGFFKSMPGRLAAVGKSIGETLGKAWNAVREGARRAVDAVVGFFKSMPGRLAAVGAAILAVFSDLPGKMLQIGKNIVDGFVNGIKYQLNGPGFVEVKRSMNNLTRFVKGIFGIRSPSTVFRDEVGRHLGTGVVAGLGAGLQGPQTAAHMARYLRGIQSFLGALPVAARKAGSQMVAALAPAWRAIASGAQGAIAPVAAAFGRLAQALSPVAARIVAVVGGAWNRIREGALRATTRIGQFFTNLGVHLAKVAQAIFLAFSTAFNRIRAVALATTQAIGQFFTNLGVHLAKVAQAIFRAFSTAFNRIRAVALATTQAIARFFQGLVPSLGSVANRVRDTFSRAFGAMRNAASSAVGAMVKTFMSLPGRLSQLPGKIAGVMSSGVKSLTKVGSDMAAGLFKGFSAFFNSNGLAEARRQIGNLTRFVKSILGIRSPSTVFRDEIGKYLAQGMVVGMVSELYNGSLKSDMAEFVKYFRYTVEDEVSKQFKDLGRWFGDAFAKGFQGSGDQINSVVSDAIDKFAALGDAIYDKGKSQADAARERLERLNETIAAQRTKIDEAKKADAEAAERNKTAIANELKNLDILQQKYKLAQQEAKASVASVSKTQKAAYEAQIKTQQDLKRADDARIKSIKDKIADIQNMGMASREQRRKAEKDLADLRTKLAEAQAKRNSRDAKIAELRAKMAGKDAASQAAAEQKRANANIRAQSIALSIEKSRQRIAQLRGQGPNSKAAKEQERLNQLLEEQAEIKDEIRSIEEDTRRKVAQMRWAEAEIEALQDIADAYGKFRDDVAEKLKEAEADLKAKVDEMVSYTERVREAIWSSMNITRDLPDEDDGAAKAQRYLAALRQTIADNPLGGSVLPLARQFEARLARAMDGFGTETADAVMSEAEKAFAELGPQLGQGAAQMVDQLRQMAAGAAAAPATSAMEKVMQRARDELAKVKDFSATVKKLADSGLDKRWLDQIIQDGPFGAMVNAWKDADAAQIRELNNIAKEMDSFGQQIGDTGAEAMYGAGVRAAEALVAGLKSQQAQIDAMIAALGTRIAQIASVALGVDLPTVQLPEGTSAVSLPTSAVQRATPVVNVQNTITLDGEVINSIADERVDIAFSDVLRAASLI